MTFGTTRAAAISHQPSAISLTTTLAIVALAAAAPLRAQQPMTLQQVIALAQKQGLQARAVLDTIDAARWRDRAFNARLMPQLSLAGTLPNYQRQIIPVTQPDGATLFLPHRETMSDLNMVLSQRVPMTGGSFFVASGLQRVDVGGDQAPRLYSSSPVPVGLSQDIFRPNALKWDSHEQDLATVHAPAPAGDWVDTSCG